MIPKENYTAMTAVAFALTLAILGSFQLYIAREPARIALDKERDQLIAVTEGRSLFSVNCAMCHGGSGEGVDGPPLNDSTFLQNTMDATIFGIVGTGVPGTEMPAWSQAHGGPLTDQEITSLVAFIRDWEDGAPDRQAEAMLGDPADGLTIFNSTCVVCHGEGGRGTEIAPQLNNEEQLTQFDDEWFVDTISQGRPAAGMPTWGTVLSPVEIRDLVALLRTWQRGEDVEAPGAAETLGEALHMLGHGDIHAVEHALEAALTGSSAEVHNLIEEALQALEANDLEGAEEIVTQILELLGGEHHGDEHSD